MSNNDRWFVDKKNMAYLGAWIVFVTVLAIALVFRRASLFTFAKTDIIFTWCFSIFHFYFPPALKL